MIAAVSLRLLYLIFCQVLGLLLSTGRTSSTKDIELIVLRHVWGSRSRPEVVTCGDRRYPAARHDHGVSVRMLYLIFGQFLSWLTLFGRTTSSKDIELPPA
jgi:hypothetical protein